MLYPQQEYKFNTINESTWEWLQKEAKERLKMDGDPIIHPDVKKHMQSIIDGKIPFGWKLRETDD